MAGDIGEPMAMFMAANPREPAIALNRLGMSGGGSRPASTVAGDIGEPMVRADPPRRSATRRAS